jgi:plastocyanin
MRMFFRTPLGGFVIFLPALMSMGCGAAAGMKGEPEPAPAVQAGPAEVQVTIDNFTYAPPDLTVNVGTKVTWTNHDDVPHTVTSTTRPRRLESPTLDTNESFSHVFKEPGTYSYFCAVHPKMTGTVTVK